MRRVTIAAAFVALAACQKAPSGKPPVTEAEATKIAEAAEATFGGQNVNAIMDHYAKDAVLIDASHPDPSADRKVQAGWAGDFVSMAPQDFHVINRHIQLLGGDAFVSSGTETFTVAAGQARPTVSARFTDVYARGADGEWKIVHEHTSMPPTPPGQPQQ
jgi:ketosteroid isomerase-like protein